MVVDRFAQIIQASLYFYVRYSLRLVTIRFQSLRYLVLLGNLKAYVDLERNPFQQLPWLHLEK